MKLRIANGRIALPGGVCDSVSLEIADGRISSMVRGVDAKPDLDLEGGWLLPGFVDTQVNGGGGVLFNDDPSVAGIKAIGAAHARFGTTSFLPTLISDSPDRISAALDAVDEAIRDGIPGVIGAHIEGPFINEIKRGIHESGRIRRLDSRMMRLLCRRRAGKVLLTLAPEQCAAEDIASLVAAGVIVSAGHSCATYAEAGAAIAAGMTGFTHLFNAMSPLTHREPGAVGAAFDFPGTWCGLIVDRAHLHDAAVRLAIRAIGRERIMLVTDAMPSVGTELDRFALQGKEIWVRDGVCAYADGTLAGSDLDMATAVRNTVAITGLDVPEAAEMASRSPAAFLGLSASHGSLLEGARADWVWLDGNLEVRETWIGGVRHCGGEAGKAKLAAE